MKTPAGGGGRSLRSSDAGGALRFSAGGVWRQELPRLTPSRRHVLAVLARGDSLVIDSAGEIRFRGSGAAVSLSIAGPLIGAGWVTEPLAALPLFGEPAVDGCITDCGRAALLRGQRK